MKTFFYAKSRTINSDWEYDRFVSKQECEHYMNNIQQGIYPLVLKWEEISESEFLSARAVEDRKYVEAMNAAYGVI